MMKFALLVAFLGLQTVLAISPFEAIVEEWEVDDMEPRSLVLATSLIHLLLLRYECHIGHLCCASRLELTDGNNLALNTSLQKC